MYRTNVGVIVAFLAIVACSPRAESANDAEAIADRYLSGMQQKGYAFLSPEELLRRREMVAAPVSRTLEKPLTEPERAAMLEGIDRCLGRLYSKAAGEVDYGNGFGSGGEEWMYLNDGDHFRTFQYRLWFGLTATPVDAQRRDTQRKWRREYLANMPGRGELEPLPREGMHGEEVRAWVIGELEKAFADPMHPLSQPMPDDWVLE